MTFILLSIYIMYNVLKIVDIVNNTAALIYIKFFFATKM